MSKNKLKLHTLHSDIDLIYGDPRKQTGKDPYCFLFPSLRYQELQTSKRYDASHDITARSQLSQIKSTLTVPNSKKLYDQLNRSYNSRIQDKRMIKIGGMSLNNTPCRNQPDFYLPILNKLTKDHAEQRKKSYKSYVQQMTQKHQGFVNFLESKKQQIINHTNN